MPKTAIIIGPKDHGRRMSLAEFDHAEVQEGHLYELSRGVITVSDVPNRRHAKQVISIRDQFVLYKYSHPGKIEDIYCGAECKILIDGLESERHPDIAVYKHPPEDEDDLWRTWIPEIVVEVVSPGSETRDYEEKREEYLSFGVKEYWIVDVEKREVLVLHRSGDAWTERIVRPPKFYRPRLLPGFEFSCAQVFEAADVVRE